MTARVLDFWFKCDEPDGDALYQIYLDFSENTVEGDANFFDKNHEPCLTWCESNFYPSDHKDTVYFMANENLPFKVLGE